MAGKTGFTSMADAKGKGKVPVIGVGLLGGAFMGKSHSNAWKKVNYMMYPPPAIPKLAAICDIVKDVADECVRRYGWEKAYTDWKKMLDDDDVQVLDNGGPNGIHAEPCIAAAKAGKHILCEKPLARTADEAGKMLDAVKKAKIKHMVGFNYRFVPAITQIKQLIDSGKLGKIYHFRAVYLQEWIMPHYGTPLIWRLQKAAAGSGALGDLGAHIIDLGRYFLGEPKSVSAVTRTFITERAKLDGKGKGKVDVDDAFIATVEFANGAIGSVEASRFAAGRKNGLKLEINAEKASITFDLERMNELEIFWVGEDPKETQGFHRVNVSEAYHPYWSNWWPHGHIIGWEHAQVHEVTHLLDCIANNKEVGPQGATFEDGYRNAVICDAILASAAEKRAVDIKY